MARTRVKSTRKKTAGKKSARKKATKSRKRLTPRKEKRGPAGVDVPLDLATPEIRPFTEQVRELGGAAIGCYREPFSGKPLLVASLPIEEVQPTPFQRELSPAHTKRLAEKIEESGAFLDPLIVVRGAKGEFWTPNGRHRLAAAKLLGLRQITVLISPDEDLAFRILALNTEKAHNLRDRGLEVIRMARELAVRDKRAREIDYQAEFESAALLTLGILFEQERRFAGGAYHPFLRKVDRFSSRTLARSLREREGRAARLLAIDREVVRIVEKLRERGFRSAYLRNLVVARINPVRFHRAKKGETKPPMEIGAALTRMAASAKRFNVASVREIDLALMAAVAGDDEG